MVTNGGLLPILNIFSSADSPSTLSLSHAVLAKSSAALTNACNSALVNNGANASDTYIVTTEEFTAESTSLNLKTITDS